MAPEGGDRPDLIGIGDFSLLTDVTISTLRHYHQAGLLVPCEVDPWTGYRRYRPDQAQTAQAIRALRSLEMPLDDIGGLLRADEAEARRIWTTHLERLQGRVKLFQRGVAVIEAALLGQSVPALETIVELLGKEAVTMIETTSCRLVGVTLCVPDIDAAEQFYRQVFGIEFTVEQHPGGPRHMHASGGTWRPQEFFLFTLWPGDGSRQRANVEFTVEDVDVTWHRALEAGATSLCEPYDSGEYPRNASFTDPFGNLVGVYAA